MWLIWADKPFFEIKQEVKPLPKTRKLLRAIDFEIHTLRGEPLLHEVIRKVFKWDIVYHRGGSRKFQIEFFNHGTGVSFVFVEKEEVPPPYITVVEEKIKLTNSGEDDIVMDSEITFSHMTHPDEGFQYYFGEDDSGWKYGFLVAS